MGAMTQFMPAVLEAQQVKLSTKHLADIQMFSDTMRFYARRDLDKSSCEDKHLFRPDELMRIGQDCGMRFEQFSNWIFANIEHRSEPLPEYYFEQFYYDYLKYAMSWDEDLIKLFKQYGKIYFEYFSVLGPAGAMPYTHSTFLFKKL